MKVFLQNAILQFDSFIIFLIRCNIVKEINRVYLTKTKLFFHQLNSGVDVIHEVTATLNED